MLHPRKHLAASRRGCVMCASEAGRRDAKLEGQERSDWTTNQWVWRGRGGRGSLTLTKVASDTETARRYGRMGGPEPRPKQGGEVRLLPLAPHRGAHPRHALIKKGAAHNGRKQTARRGTSLRIAARAHQSPAGFGEPFPDVWRHMR